MFLKEPLGAERAASKQILRKGLIHSWHDQAGLLGLNYVVQACVKEVSTVEPLMLEDLRQSLGKNTSGCLHETVCCRRDDLRRHVTKGTGDQLSTSKLLSAQDL